MIPKAEMAALILGDSEMVKTAIQDRKKLIGDMVGTLYPSILLDEIAQLEVLYARKVSAEVRK